MLYTIFALFLSLVAAIPLKVSVNGTAHNLTLPHPPLGHLLPADAASNQVQQLDDPYPRYECFSVHAKAACSEYLRLIPKILATKDYHIYSNENVVIIASDYRAQVKLVMGSPPRDLHISGDTIAKSLINLLTVCYDGDGMCTGYELMSGTIEMEGYKLVARGPFWEI